MQTSVVEALKAAGLYKETGRIEEQTVKTLTASGEEKGHKLAEIDYLDIKTFADELDIALMLQNPYVQSLYTKNAVGLVNLMRAVNVESTSGFKGSVGSGRQLDALLLRAEQFQNPDEAADTARASWVRDIAAAGGQGNFIVDPTEEDGEKVALEMADEEGLAILGFANPAAALCVDAIQITYIAREYNIQNLDFELANPFVGDAIVELKQPLFIYPKETALVEARYYRAGNDELRPIGLWVKMSSALRALASS
ncbi:hypothetical protein ES708_10880 [subsurface metagenome]